MWNFEQRLIERLRLAQRVVVLTGAGTSSESGIPTFRDVLTGLWENFDAQQLATPQAFDADPDLVWGWYEWRRGLVAQCQPNPAHQAIAAMQDSMPDLTVVTQNVDDLHERAGSRNVIHLHGSLHHPRCRDCAAPYMFSDTMPDEPVGGRRLTPPGCLQCGGPIRPGVVWFGEALPVDNWAQAQALASTCDVLFSVGTSSLVYPAANLPYIARDAGACIVQVNPQPTGLESIVDYDLQGNAGKIMPALIQAVWPDADPSAAAPIAQ